MTAYTPASLPEMAKAVFALVKDERRRPGAAGKTAETPKARKQLVEPAAAVLGMLLAGLDSSTSGSAAATAVSVADASALSGLQSELLKLLYSLIERTEEAIGRLVYTLHALSAYYPQVLLLDNAFFTRHAQSLLPKVYGVARVQILDCLTRCVSLEKREDVKGEEQEGAAAMQVDGAAGGGTDGAAAFQVQLLPNDLDLVLRQTQAGVQQAALRLVTALCTTRGASAVYPLLATLNTAFIGHNDRECRALHLRLAMKVHEAAVRDAASSDDAADGTVNGSVNDTAISSTKAHAEAVERALLHGLSDADADGVRGEAALREEVLTFWHKSVLAPKLGGRLVECFGRLYGSDVEARWLHYCGVLMLALPLESPNAGRAMFRPLREGLTFQPHRAVGTHTISASTAMQPWGSQSASQSQDDLGGSQDGYGGPLRATQERMFSQTQTQAAGDAAALGALSTYSSQANGILWAASGRGNGNAPLQQVPRFDADAPAAASSSQASQSQPTDAPGTSAANSKNEPMMGKRFKVSSTARQAAGVRARDAIRARALAASEGGRAAKVAVYRSYRVGELPDVAITPRDLLAPLQALVHHDALVARLAFGQLYSAVRRAQNLDDDPKAIEALHTGVASLLGTHGGPAFVGCLHELALSEAGSDLRWLPVADVATSARHSGNLHSGILILERHLLAAEPTTDSRRGGGGGGKRSRNSAASDAGLSAPGRAESMAILMHLADLYRGVGDEDVVRGISAGLASSDHVRAALAAEARGDAAEAYERYQAALKDAETDAAADAPSAAPAAGSSSGGGGGGAFAIDDDDNGDDVGSAVSRWERRLVRRGVLSAQTLLSQWGTISHDTRLAMARACGVGPDATMSEADGANGTSESMSFRGSLAQSWVRLWAVSHSKLAGAAAGGLGWGAWPVHDTEGDEQGAAWASPAIPSGAPHARRDASKLLDAGHGSLLLMDRLAADDVNGVRSLLPQTVHAFVRRWGTLHPLAEGARLAELRPLQIVTEAAELAALLEREAPFLVDEATGTWKRSPAHAALTSTWAVRLPSVAHHDASAWDDLVCARKRMLATLRQATARALSEQRSGRAYLDASERDELMSKFDRDADTCLLSLYNAASDAARRQGNFRVAQAHLEASRPYRQRLGEAMSSPALAIKIFRLRVERERARAVGDGTELVSALSNVHAKLADLFADKEHTLTTDEACDLRTLRASVAWSLVETSSGTRAAAATDDAALADQALGWLQQNADEADPALPRARHAAMRLELVDLCNKAIQRLAGTASGDGEGAGGGGVGGGGAALAQQVDRLSGVAMEQVLRAMSDGSLEARDRLPSALALCRGAPQRWAAATALLERPPMWMALTWASQLIAMLYEAHGAVVAPLLTRLAVEYPQPLYFPFHVSRRALAAHGALAADPVRAQALAAMEASLHSPEIERLVAGFNDLLHPNLRLSDLLKELLAKLDAADGDGAAAHYVAERARWMVPRGGGGRGRDERGAFLIEFASEFGKDLDAVCGADGRLLRTGGAAVRKAIRQLLTGKMESSKLKSWMAKRTSKANGNDLANYSASLAKYHRSDTPTPTTGGRLCAIELPGQYSGDRPPQPSTHVYLECVESSLLLLPSLRMPKRVTIRGSDQRDYRFLCKGGEDLRLDQRVQLLFGAMNRCLEAHAPSAARGLELATYHVLPLAESVGLIEWVDGTKTLKTLITDEAHAREAAARGGRGAAGAKGDPQVLVEAMDRYTGSRGLHAGGNFTKALSTNTGSMSRSSVTAVFDASGAGVPSDLLARAVHALSVSAEVYLAMRSLFAKSLAAFTACSHVLGIGDRHLDNFLLNLSTGRVVGIDFGHAFGSATYILQVPELMGVRLTRQLTSFLRPLDTSVLLKGHMVAALEALRARRAELMRLMEVFLSEPIVDWEAQTRKLSAEQRRRLEEDGTSALDGAALPTQLDGTLNDDAGGSAAAMSAANAAASTSRAAASSTGRAAAVSASVALSKGWAAERLGAVDWKLQGGNSARITLSEVATSAVPTIVKSQSVLEDIVLGDSDSLRRALPRTGLSAAEQVDVLVEQATDSNVLGRTYNGWMPFL